MPPIYLNAILLSKCAKNVRHPLTAIQWSWWHVTKKGTLMAKLNLKDSLGSIMEKASVKAEEIGETVSETAKEGLKIANQKAQDARQEIRKRYY